MKKIEEAKDILAQLGLPAKQCNDRSALTLLALANLGKSKSWRLASNPSMSVVGNKNSPKYPGIMRFILQNYKIPYAENTREVFRRQTLHPFVQAGIIQHNPENPALPTTSKDNHYRLTEEVLDVLKTYGTKHWKDKVGQHLKENETLKSKYSKRSLPLSIDLPDKIVNLSPGAHNELQKKIIEVFRPRFAKRSQILYLGDTGDKSAYFEKMALEKLGVKLNTQSKLPDIILYEDSRKWLYLIEAVTSHGPVSPKRLIELEKLFKGVAAIPIYVTCFLDKKTFKKFVGDIAWETDVWISEDPDHMVHFNGDKFLGK